MKVLHPALLLLSLVSSSLTAQEFIPLSEDDVYRLAIIFAPVTTADRQSGSRFPATVVNSPDATSVVTAPYAGVLESWHVIPGEPVESGSLLASVRSQEILDIQNQWLDAVSELAQAEFVRRRDEELYQQGIVSEQRVQQSLREFQQAQIAVNSYAGRLSRANFTEEDLQALQGSSQRLGIYTLEAPHSGVVSHRALVVGEYVAAFNEVASLQISDRPWLSVQVPARLAVGLKPGHPLTLAGSGEFLELKQKDLLIDETTQTIELLAEFTTPVSYLPGQILSVVITPVESGVLIPADAVIHNGDETVVFVQANQGVQARALQLDPAGNNYIARSGISAGEFVVIQGASVLKGIQLGLGSTE